MSDINWITTIATFIGPLLLTCFSFWVYFKGKALKEMGANLSPIWWAGLVHTFFIIGFPIFFILKETKWKKEAIRTVVYHKTSQGKRILVIILFFVVYILSFLLIIFF